MRGVNIDDGDYDYPYIYGDDILYLWWYTKVMSIPRTQGTRRTATTTPVILEPPRVCKIKCLECLKCPRAQVSECLSDQVP